MLDVYFEVHNWCWREFDDDTYELGVGNIRPFWVPSTALGDGRRGGEKRGSEFDLKRTKMVNRYKQEWKSRNKYDKKIHTLK